MSTARLRQHLDVAFARLLALMPGSRSGTLLIPPAGPGSAGDEAMLRGLAPMLEARGDGPVHILARNFTEVWPPMNGSAGSLGPGDPSPAWWMKLARLMRRKKRVLLLGADCIDGHYLNSIRLVRFLELAAAAGCDTVMVGASFRENATPEVCRAFAALPASVRLCSRDPDSHERMTRLTGRKIDLTADAAFLMQPDDAHAEVQRLSAWCSQRRSDSPDCVILGVNINRQVLTKEQQAQRNEIARMEDAVALALERLLAERPGLSVLAIPHDWRGEPSDADSARILADRLNARFAGRAEAVREEIGAHQIKAVAGQTDAVLTGRMHLAIATLGMGRPVACVTYQGKFTGLYKHFELAPLIVEPTDAFNPDKLHAVTRELLDRRVELRDAVQRALPTVRKRSEANLLSRRDT